MYKIHITEFAVMKIAKHLYNVFHLKCKYTQMKYLFEIQFENHSLASANEYNCNCGFNKMMELPCLHIFFVRKEVNKDLFDLSLVNKRCI